MRGVFEVFDATGERLPLAVERLRNMEPFIFSGVLIQPHENGQIAFEAIAECFDSKLLESDVPAHIKRAKQVASYLREISPEFAAVLTSAPVRYAVIQDCGMTTIEVCREHEGKIQWSTGWR